LAGEQDVGVDPVPIPCESRASLPTLALLPPCQSCSFSPDIVTYVLSVVASALTSSFQNYYIPPIIFAVDHNEEGEEKRVTIDGKQRCTAIVRFMDGEIPYVPPGTRRKLYYRGTRGRGEPLPNGLKNRFDMTNVVAVEYDHIADETQRDIFRECLSAFQRPSHRRTAAPLHTAHRTTMSHPRAPSRTSNTAHSRRTRPARCCPLGRREAPSDPRSLGYLDRRAAQEIHPPRGHAQRRHPVGHQARQAIPGSRVDGPSLSRSHEDEPADFHRDAQVAREVRRGGSADLAPFSKWPESTRVIP
jgi:hypothetical protein